jgi:hypothetical protein
MSRFDDGFRDSLKTWRVLALTERRWKYVSIKHGAKGM